MTERRLKPYPGYKDSGVEWLGEVPEHWEVRRLDATVGTCQNGVWGDEPDGLHDVVCVRVADFDRVTFSVDLENQTLRSVEPASLGAHLLRPGDLLLEKSGGGENQPVGAVVLFDHAVPAVCSNFVARMTVPSGFVARYLTYMHAALYALRINTRHIKQSTGIQNLNASSYLGEAVGLPSEPEQRAIAAFLDRETARIDALVAKKERLIDLLQEQRTALITRAVTKGLDPNAPMKDTGIEWLGEIPAHWEVKRLGFLLDGRPKNGVSPAIGVNGTTPTFSTTAVADGVVGIEGQIKYTAVSSHEAKLFLLLRGDVLMLRGSGSRALVGRAGIVIDEPPEGCIYPDILIRLRHIVSVTAWYLVACLNSTAVRPAIELAAKTAAGIWKITSEDVQNLAMPLPPRQEQVEIESYVTEGAARIDALVAKVRDAMDRLKELRTALISAAVTGKIDVRDEAGLVGGTSVV